MKAIRERLGRDVRHSDHGAWLGAVMAAAITLAGMIVETRLSLRLPGMPRWHAHVGALLAAATLALLLARRRNPTFRQAAVTFTINALAMLTILYATNPYYAGAAVPWVPFQGNKLGCLMAALLSPSLAIGLGSVVLYSTAAVLQYQTFDAVLQERLAFGEPLMTVAFGLAGVVTLVFRFGKVRLERSVLKAEADAAAATRIARMLLGIRDLMNTPLQTLEIASTLLRDRQTSGADCQVSDGIRRSVDRLREVNDALAKLEARLPPADEPAALDGLRLMREVAATPDVQPSG